jgi:hypothetical protein
VEMPKINNSFLQHSLNCPACRVTAPDGTPAPLCDEGFRLLQESINCHKEYVRKLRQKKLRGKGVTSE